MSTISFSGANTRLSYRLNGSNIARLRCSRLIGSYGVDATQSQSKRYRAFYPHQRVQGSFSMTFDFIHWREFDQGMAWFRAYVEAVINQQSPSYMQVQLDARNFLRLGYPTVGISHGDRTASNVFSPTITFVSVADPRDPRSGIQSLNADASRYIATRNNPTANNWFYPESHLNYPGKTESDLYDGVQISAAAKAASVQETISGTAGATTSEEVSGSTFTSGLNTGLGG